MADNKKYTIIDAKEGNVLGEFSSDKVILKGTYPYENSEFAENLQLEITSKNGKIVTKEVPYSGYFLKLFLGDFTGDGKDEVMVRGTFGGSGNYAIAAIYQYKNDNLNEIFSQDIYDERYKFTARYLENYKVEVINTTLKQKYIIDISSKDKIILNMIYDSDGRVKKDQVPYVSSINEAYPINYTYKNNYSLFTQQRIVGVSNSDTIGVIESFIDLTDGNIKIYYSGVMTLGEKYDESSRLYRQDKFPIQLPLGGIPISLDKFGGKNGVIHADLDGDGKEETLIAYTLDGIPYIAVYGEKEFKLIDVYKGMGYNVEDLKIEFGKDSADIFVGWKIGAKANKLDILTFKKGKLYKKYKRNLPYYGKLFLEDIDGDGDKEIILWTHDTGEAYTISIYEDNLKLTNKYDKIYYEKVKHYYEKLLDQYGESSTYLYYLAMAQYKIGEYEDSIKTINKALNTKYPYPSVKELNELKKNIKKSI